MTEDIMNQIENHMVLPYADDDPIEEPQEPEFDKDLENLNDQLRGVTDSVDELFRIYREQAE